MEKQRLHYYEQLAELYPTIGKASTEIINLQSILYLPKGTEHFLSDIHGEFKAFSHVLRNGSGAVRKKIDDVFGHTLSTADKMSLATLIYYPQKKIELVRQTEDDIENWYKITLYRLIEVCKTVSSKYTRSKVRKALPEDYAYVIEELITEKQEVLNKEPMQVSEISGLCRTVSKHCMNSVMPTSTAVSSLAYARAKRCLWTSPNRMPVPTFRQ